MTSGLVPFRVGEAFEGDEHLTVLGKKLKVGQQAPDFWLQHIQRGGDGSIKTVSLGQLEGMVRIISPINAIETQVCKKETDHWIELLDLLPYGAGVLVVSTETVFTLGRWQQDIGTSRVVLLSDFIHRRFGVDYGVLIKEWGLLQRAVFVIDPHGRLAYVEYVKDQMVEPDYEAAIAAAKAVGPKGADG